MASNNSSVYNNSHISGQDIAFAVMYSFIVIIGVPANCMIVTIVRKTPSRHTTTNYLLMNLAVADVTTLLLCPGMYEFSLNKMRLDKTLGDFLCKFFVGNALVPITISVGALTVCTLAVERYLALVKPFNTEIILAKRRVPHVVAFLWVFAVLSCIPDFMTNTIEPDRRSIYPCKRPWSLEEYFYHKGFIIYKCVFFGIIPCMLVSFCYFKTFRELFSTNTSCPTPTSGPRSEALSDQRSKKQVFKLLVSLTLVFIVCALPFSLFFIHLTAIDKTSVADNLEVLYVAHRTVRFLLYANSFFNPLLYAFQSSNYRKRLKGIFCCKSSTGTNDVHCARVRQELANVHENE